MVAIVLKSIKTRSAQYLVSIVNNWSITGCYLYHIFSSSACRYPGRNTSHCLIPTTMKTCMRPTSLKPSWGLAPPVARSTVTLCCRAHPWWCHLLILQTQTWKDFQILHKLTGWSAYWGLVMFSLCLHFGGMKCSPILTPRKGEIWQWTIGEDLTN